MISTAMSCSKNITRNNLKVVAINRHSRVNLKKKSPCIPSLIKKVPLTDHLNYDIYIAKTPHDALKIDVLQKRCRLQIQVQLLLLPCIYYYH